MTKTMKIVIELEIGKNARLQELQRKLGTFRILKINGTSYPRA